ncbi:MAG: hypothetical protein ACT4N4_09540, partial [Rhodospirillales bacterium]
MTLVKGGSAARPEARSSARPAARFTPVAAIFLLSSVTLGACGGAFDRYFGTDKPPPPQQPADPAKQTSTTESAPEATNPPGQEKPYPNLGSVPQQRPVRQSIEEQRQAIQQGLVADRQNARYTDQVIRHEPVSSAPPARPITAAVSVPRLPTVPGAAPPQGQTQTQPQTQARPAGAAARAPTPGASAQVAAAPAGGAASSPPPPPALPQPSLPALAAGSPPAVQQPDATAVGRPIPIAPPPPGQQAAPSRPFAPPPSAASAPPPSAAQQAAPLPVPGRSNFTLGTAVVQAIEAPPEAAAVPPPSAPQQLAQAPATIPVAPPAGSRQ